jgi:hypothetical protein
MLPSLLLFGSNFTASSEASVASSDLSSDSLELTLTSAHLFIALGDISTFTVTNNVRRRPA